MISTNFLQTPKGFPSQKQPDILRIFYKNGHQYMKDYGLKAKALGARIMCWWEEVKSTGSTVNVQFGGPTGVYNLVVLMSWWCSLLKGRPDNELSDCLHTLNDIDCVILSAIHNTVQPPRPSTTPPAQPRGSKRTATEDPLSRKHFCAQA